MISILSTLVLAIAGLGFLYAAATDFTHWKIYNSTVLFVILMYAPYLLLASQISSVWPFPTDFLSSASAAGLLFAIGFLLWQIKLLGAGDAKLMFPIGLYIGWPNLLFFALFLIFFAIAGTLLLKFPLPYGLSRTWAGIRLNEIRRTGKVPYGVIMVAALLMTMVLIHQQWAAGGPS